MTEFIELVMLFSIGLSSAAQTEHRWVQVARTPEVTVEVDTATVVTDGGTLRLWERFHVPSHRLKKSGKISDRAVARVELRCWGATSRTVTVLSYNAGSLLEVDDLDDSKFTPIVPNSTQEAVYRYICPRYPRGPR